MLIQNMSDTDDYSTHDSMIDSDEDEEEERDWDSLLEPKFATQLIHFLGEKCPAYVCLHRGRLHNNVWENTYGKNASERHEKYEKCLEKSWHEIYALCATHFQGEDWTRWEQIPLREEEEPWEILEDFWLQKYENWMLITNGDVRDILKPLESKVDDPEDIRTLASIHYKMAMSNANMTSLCSQICKIEKPNIYAVLRAIEETNRNYEPDYSKPQDEFMWNMPAARDTLNHLVKDLM